MPRQGRAWLIAPLALALGTASAPAHAQQNLEAERVVTQGTTVSKLAVPSRGGERCKARKAERWGKNAVGRKVIRFHQTVKWCWNSKRITYTRRRNHGETPGFVWDFKGYRDRYRDSSRKPGRWYRFVATGKFSLCADVKGVGGCLNHKFYTIRQTVFRGGGYRVDTSG